MKVTFFIGREHHAQKLLPVAMKGLELEKIEPQFLIADNAINIDPPSEFLGRYPDISVNNVVHLKNYESLGVDVDAESRGLIKKMFSSDTSNVIAPFWLAYSAREAVRIKSLGVYLDDQKPDAVFILHSQNFWARRLAYESENRGIPVFSLREGISLQREERDMGKHTGATKYVTKLFSWSPSDKDDYAQPDRSKIITVGPPHLDQWVSYRDDKRLRTKLRHKIQNQLRLVPNRPTIMFAPPRLDLYVGDPVEDLKLMSYWAVRNQVNIIVKLHPFQGRDKNIENVALIYPCTSIYGGKDTIAVILSSDAVVTQTSTVSIEAIAMGVPVIEIDTKYIGLDQPLHEIGVASLMTGGDTGVLQQVLGGTFDIESLSRFIITSLSMVDGGSSERIIEEITNA